MRICLFSKATSAHGLGGVQTHVESLTKTIPALGHSLTVLATRHPDGVEKENRHGSIVYYLSGTREAYYNKLYWDQSVHRFASLHEENPFDIVWSEDFGAYGYVNQMKRQYNVPLISIFQGPAFGSRLRSEWNRVNHCSELVPYVTKFLPEAFLFHYFWYKRLLEGADHVVSVSRENALEYQKQYNLLQDKVSTIFNAINTERFKPNEEQRQRIRATYSIREDEKLLLMAAIVHKQKGMHLGVEAFHEIKKNFPTTKLMIVGDGPDLRHLKEKTQREEISNDVIFCGGVSNKEIHAYYNAADIFLNPTLRLEGLPINTLEAMACGKPVIISRGGGTLSTIEEGVSGFFIPLGDVSALTQRTMTLLEDSSLAEKMGANSRKRALAVFDEDKMAESFVSLSEKIISSVKDPGRHGMTS